MEKINVVVVGYGGMGRYHANHIEEFENFNLVGIYDIKQEACDVAVEKGVYVYPSFEAVLEDEKVELIVCATYNDCHKDIAIRAMKAGKAVYVEKPMASNYEDCCRINRIAETSGVPCFVAYYRRYLPLPYTYTCSSVIHSSRNMYYLFIYCNSSPPVYLPTISFWIIFKMPMIIFTHSFE